MCRKIFIFIPARHFSGCNCQPTRSMNPDIIRLQSPGITFSRVLILSALCLQFFLYPLSGQDNYYVKTYTTENGLPHNDIRCIAQDKTGFLWIATWDGLSRFDGYEFRNYYHRPGDSTSIPFFIVLKVCVDGSNNVWVLCEHNKIVKYNRSKDGFISFESSITNSVNTSNHLDADVDTNGNVWIIAPEGVIMVDPKEMIAELAIITDNKGYTLKINRIGNLFVDDCNYLWLNEHNSLLRFSIIKSADDKVTCKKNGEFNLVQDKEYISSKIGFNNFYAAFYTVPESVLLISDKGLFTTVAKNSLRYSRLDALNKPLYGNVLTINNINHFLKYYYSTEISSLPQQNLRFPGQIFFDLENCMWLSAPNENGSGKGLIKIQKVNSRFRHYPDYRANNNINKVAVSAILKDQYGIIWIGSRSNRNYHTIMQFDKNLYQKYITNDFKISGQVRSLIEDRNGIWIGYNSGHLVYYDWKTRNTALKIDPLKLTIPGKQPFSIHSMTHDRMGGLILSGNGIIYHYNPENSLVRLISDTIVPLNAYCLVQDDSNNYWLGSGNSMLYCFDSSFNKLRKYQLSVPGYNLEDICIRNNGELWITTLGGGICRFDPYTGKKEFFTTANGLSNNTTYGIRKDKKGNLWISTNRGISKYNPSTQKFRIFGPADGLKIEEFNSDAVFHSADGELFFGGMGGTVGFYPDSLEEVPPSGENYPVVITGFSVSGFPRYFEKAVYEIQKVMLNKGDNNFGVTFSCLDFSNADKIQYRYRLLDYDKNWIVTDHLHRFVNYAGLSPGKYTLEIEATDREGDWISKTSLNIVIPSFYYQTTWFILLAGLFILLIISSLLFQYNRQIRLRARQEQQHLRLESLRGQMNPHFIFNSLNSINYFISNNDRLSANRYIADFSRLIRSVIGNMALEYVSLSAEIDSLKEYLNLEHLRFGDKFDYAIEIEENIEIDSFKVFPGLVQPFIENAIWHGVRGLESRKGFVAIAFYFASEGKLQCRVEDNGVGRKLSAERKSKMQNHRSRGIGIVLERLKIINGLRKTNHEVRIEDMDPDREETGTRVVVDIPYLTTE